jgi:hypothetical protein
MTGLLILLGFISSVASATMDEIRFHWDRLFKYIAKPGTKLEKWANPSISWYNKYKFKNQVLNFIYGSAAVWVTDLWHSLKAIHLLSLFSIIILALDPTIELKIFIPTLAIGTMAYGIISELTWGIFGAISDKIKNK